MSAFQALMQPCDGWPGINCRWFVPWIPMTLPLDQLDSVGDYADVPNARVA